MDLVAPAQHLDEVELTSEQANECKRVITDLVTSFHNNGLVHGDLRSPNILLSGKAVMLIDFDWGGKDGEAHYPTVQLCQELLTGRILSDLNIRKRDDLRILQDTLKRIRIR